MDAAGVDGELWLFDTDDPVSVHPAARKSDSNEAPRRHPEPSLGILAVHFRATPRATICSLSDQLATLASRLVVMLERADGSDLPFPLWHRGKQFPHQNHEARSNRGVVARGTRSKHRQVVICLSSPITKDLQSANDVCMRRGAGVL